MTSFVIDAHSWVEYFNGSLLGAKIKEIIENSNNSINTSIITIAELSSYFNRKNYDFEEAKKIILSLSNICQIDFDLAEQVGKFHADIKKERKNISLADIFVLKTARKINAKVITGDQDFKGLKDVILVK